MHTSTFGLKFGSLSPAMTLKIRSRSPKPNQLFIMSQCYSHANLVKIHPPVHEISCKQESHANANDDANRIRTKNNMSPSPSVGDIISLKELAPSPYFSIINVHINVFAKFYEILSLPFQDIEKPPKRHRRD